jgi:hypothetical protein
MQYKDSIIDITLNIFFRPKVGIKKVKKLMPSLKLICIILFFIGLFRGILETMAVYILANKLNLFFISLGSIEWYLYNGGPFIIANIVSPFFFWATTSFIVFKGARFLGGKGKFGDSIRIFGLFMVSYLFIIIINFIHIYFEIPFIYFEVSPVVVPLFGIGHIIVFVWLTVLSYLVCRKIYMLDKISAAFISPLPALFGISLYVTSSALSSIFFQNRTLPTFFTLDILYIVILSIISFSIFVFELRKDKGN